METKEGEQWLRELAKWGRDIDQLAIHAGRISGMDKDELEQQLQRLREREIDARIKVRRLYNATLQTASDLKVGAAKAMADLKLAFAKAQFALERKQTLEKVHQS